MKVPLEPIPTEQIVLVKQKPPGRELRAAGATRAMAGAMDAGRPPVKAQADAGQLEKAYPWLLGVSTCLSALLCWMYVTKPVIVQESPSPAARPAVQAAAGNAGNPADKAEDEPAVASLVPSDTRLPGSDAPSGTVAKPVSAQSAHGDAPLAPLAVDPRMLSKAGDAREESVAVGWEKTNLKVQHILSADAGTGSNEKIVLNVPVLYQTRSMRWTPDKIMKAQDVLARLMLYERSLSNLRKDGESIVADWNAIIRDSVPASALRADSPSLPYNHGQGGSTGLPGSSSVIQVEEN